MRSTEAYVSNNFSDKFAIFVGIFKNNNIFNNNLIQWGKDFLNIKVSISLR
jgi:hypothetical protein